MSCDLLTNDIDVQALEIKVRLVAVYVDADSLGWRVSNPLILRLE
jgi:hypothetical protein